MKYKTHYIIIIQNNCFMNQAINKSELLRFVLIKIHIKLTLPEEVYNQCRSFEIYYKNQHELLQE